MKHLEYELYLSSDFFYKMIAFYYTCYFERFERWALISYSTVNLYLNCLEMNFLISNYLRSQFTARHKQKLKQNNRSPATWNVNFGARIMAGKISRSQARVVECDDEDWNSNIHDSPCRHARATVRPDVEIEQERRVERPSNFNYIPFNVLWGNSFFVLHPFHPEAHSHIQGELMMLLCCV